MSVISFPGLGVEFSVDNVAFSIGGFDIYWYGVLIGLSLLLGLLYAVKKSRSFGIDSDRMLDVVMVGALFGVICGRLFYVVSHLEEFTDFASIINLRGGGIAIYGVFIGGFAAALIMCKIRKVNAPAMFDIVSVCFLVGQAIGRWGNFFNEEAFGTNTDLPWGMTSTKIASYLRTHAEALAARGVVVDPSLPVHPTFLYESIWCLIGAIILLVYMKRRRFDGEMFLMYGVWYGTGRAVIETIRTDALYWGNVRISLLLSVIAAVACLALLIFVRMKQRKNPEFRPIYATTQECKDYFAKIDEAAAEKQRKKTAKHEKKSEADDGDDNDKDDTEEEKPAEAAAEKERE